MSHDTRAPDGRPTTHPDEVMIASYVEGRLPEAARAEMEAHLAGCEGCRVGVALLSLGDDEEAAAADPTEDEIAGYRRAALDLARPSRGRRGGWPLALAAAATLAVVAFAGYLVTLPERQPPSAVERAGERSGLVGLEPIAGASIDAAALRFRWNAVEGADRYVVEVTDLDGQRLATIEARGAVEEVAWPEDLPRPRGTLLWRVRAMTVGQTLDETRPIAFECR